MEWKIGESVTLDVNVTLGTLMPGDETKEEEYRKSDSVRLYLDSEIDGHTSVDGIKTRGKVKSITYNDARIYKTALMNADERLAVIIKPDASIGFLASLLTGAKLSITRTLTTKESGEETFHTVIDKITFAPATEKQIQESFQRAFQNNFY